MENNAKYVVFDGMDGSGKGTQMNLLQEKFGDSVIFTREPGGTPFAEKIRGLVRDDPLAGESTALNNFLLFWAAREDLQYKLVAPKLREGKHVFSDRGDSSTFAFQICGEQHGDLADAFDLMRQLVFHRNSWRREPDLYVVFDLPALMARERVTQAGRGKLNHFDERDLAYYERVRAGFGEFAAHTQATVAFIDARGSPEEIHQLVCVALADKAGISIK